MLIAAPKRGVGGKGNASYTSRLWRNTMSLFRVYHAKDPRFGIGEPPVFPEEYTHVADVPDCDHPDFAYRLTQNIDSSWHEEDRFVQALAGPCRSTSVGDVLVDDTEGRVYRCLPIGWEDITLIGTQTATH